MALRPGPLSTTHNECDPNANTGFEDRVDVGAVNEGALCERSTNLCALNAELIQTGVPGASPSDAEASNIASVFVCSQVLHNMAN